MRKLLTITEQTLWQIAGRIIISGCSFIALALVTRHYNKLEVGAYTLAQTYLSMFFIIADLGLNAYVLTKLKNDPLNANRLFNARFYWSIILAFLAMVFALVLPIEDGLFKMAVLFGLFSIIANGIFTSVNLILQKEFKYQLSMIASTIGSLVMVSILALLALKEVPIYLLLISYSLGWLPNIYLTLKLSSPFYHFKLLKPDTTYFFDLLKKVWPISTTLLLNVIYFRFDAFILAGTRGLAESAIYSLSFSLFQTALFIPTFIMNSYYPIILKELNDKKLLFRQLRVAFLIMVGMALMGTVLTFFLAEVVINLITGGGFDGSITSIKILSLSFPAFFGTALLMWVLVSLKEYKALMVIYSIGLLINVMLNILYTPIFSFVATSYITVLAEYAILLMQLAFLSLKKT